MNLEEKKNKLNLEIRELTSIIDMIDGNQNDYPDYKENSMNEEEFLDEQIDIIKDIRRRLISVFKD